MEKIKVGIWGAGRAGYGMHPGEINKFPELFEIVACCDILKDHCDAFAEKVPGSRTYTCPEDFLADKAIELVSVATRSPDHVGHAIQAMNAGKIVFLEKPIALTYEDALRLKAEAESRPGMLFCRHNRRFEPAFVHISEILASGVIGDPYEIKLRRHGYQRRNDWQTIVGCGGGQLNNWGPHIIEHALRFLESPVATIWGDLKKVAAVGDAEDHLKIVLKGQNGRIVDLEISGGAAIAEPEYIIFGTKGAITSDGKTITVKHLDPEVELSEISATSDTPSISNDFGNTEKLQWIENTFDVAPSCGCDTHHIWKHLFAAVRENIEFPITIDQAVEVVRITEAVRAMSSQ
ncbi:MAG: Gfo/Idh/MocA family oxidoreductase [Victivallales bacterium]|nr:Gfo/Idh/MocA family oxidoreductase [Victivallales bacterium]